MALQKVAFNLIEEREEENQLYSGFNEDETLFAVNVIASPVKSLLEVSSFTLQLTPDSIVLLPANVAPTENNAIFMWSLRDIRRYGSSPETFTLEAGRRCASGPGLFSFATPKGTYLFSMLSSYLRELMLRDEKMKGGRLEAKEKPKKPPRKDVIQPQNCLSLTPPPSPSTAGNSLSSQSENDDYSPEYENILTLSVNAPQPPRHTTVVSTYATPPAHYLQNEVEYAVVLKDKRK